MIDDIVQLPRRLSNFKKTADVTSVMIASLPISSVQRACGYESPNDNDLFGFGHRMYLPTGTDAWYRYKFVENISGGICEFFCVTPSPLDLGWFRNAKYVPIYCLWVSVTNPVDYSRRKYVLWRNVKELTRFEPCCDNIVDTPIESAIANEVRTFCEAHRCPELSEAVNNYPKDISDVLISEVKQDFSDVDAYLKLASNIKSINDAMMNDDWSVDITDIYRGIYLPGQYTSLDKIKRSSVLPFVMYGSTNILEIRHLFSPMYGVHAYARPFTTDLPDGTDISVFSNEDDDFFSIIDYIEDIPYSEFELEIFCDTKQSSLRVSNPYDMNFVSRTYRADHTKVCSEKTICALTDLLTAKFPSAKKVFVAHSWSEEAYITICYKGGKLPDRFYFDLSAAALCSRSLLRDYSTQLTFL